MDKSTAHDMSEKIDKYTALENRIHHLMQIKQGQLDNTDNIVIGTISNVYNLGLRFATEENLLRHLKQAICLCLEEQICICRKEMEEI